LHSQFFSYDPNFGFDIAAVRLKDKIYMCMFFSGKERMTRKLDFATQRLQQSNVGGLMFQKYLLSSKIKCDLKLCRILTFYTIADSPDIPPNLNALYDRKGAEFFVVDEVKINGDQKIMLLNKFKAVNSDSDLENLKDFELFDIKTSAKPYKL
jgi:hypothetical protein